MFNESKNIGKISFDYVEKGEAIDYAVHLAQTMPHFKTPEDLEHLVRHQYVADDFKPELLAQVADQLADPSNCLTVLASKSFEESTLPIHEKWYKFNYSLEKFSDERLG